MPKYELPDNSVKGVGQRGYVGASGANTSNARSTGPVTPRQPGPEKPVQRTAVPWGDTMLNLVETFQGKSDDLQAALEQIKLGVSPEDIDLVGQSGRAAGDMARQELQSSLPGILDQISSGDFARGLGGSTIAAANRSGAGAEAVRQLGNTMSREQQFMGQSILGQANQRASFQMGKNRQLFNQLIGTLEPYMNTVSGLSAGQSAMDNKPGPWQQIAQLGGAAIGLVAGGPPGAAAGSQIGSAVGGAGSTAGYNQTAQFGQLQGGSNPYNFLNR